VAAAAAAAAAAVSAAPRATYANTAAPGPRQNLSCMARGPAVEKIRPHFTQAPADDSGLECSSSCERSLLVSMRSPVDERVTSRHPKKLATDRSGRNTFALCGLGWTPSAASGAAPPRG